MRRYWAVAVVAALAVATSGYLYAQPDDDEDDVQILTVPMDRRAELSPREMSQRSDELMREMQEKFLTRVVELQKIARDQKDVIKLNCVNDKLLQLRQILNIAESSRTDMVEAIARVDDEGRYHHFGRITISHEKASVLRDEAETCVGQEALFLGPTEVDVDAPDLPDDPTTEDPFADVEIEPPAYASPFV